MSTSRAIRHALVASPPAADVARPGNFAKLAPGAYTKHIEIKDDGTIVIGPGAYADDVVAFVSGAIASNPTIAKEIKQHLVEFVDAMDARAVARHGYSASPEEAAFEWMLLQ